MNMDDVKQDENTGLWTHADGRTVNMLTLRDMKSREPAEAGDGREE